jgi:hypothetical protein
VGDWRPDPRRPGGWIYEPSAPAPDPTVTSMLPAVRPTEVEQSAKLPAVEHDGPEHPGGDWANADAYASYDAVDSRTIIDEGAP